MADDKTVNKAQTAGDNLAGLDVMFQENFDDDNARKRWVIPGGCSISVSGGRGRFTGTGTFTVPASYGREYIVQAKMAVTSANNASTFGLVFLCVNPDSYYSFVNNGNKWLLNKVRKNKGKTIGSGNATGMPASDFTLRVEITCNQFGQTVIRGYVNNQLVCSATEMGYKRGCAGLFQLSPAQLSADNFTVTCQPVAGDNFDDGVLTNWTSYANLFQEYGGQLHLTNITGNDLNHRSYLILETTAENTLDYAVQADFMLTNSAVNYTENYMGPVIEVPVNGGKRYFWFGYYWCYGAYGWSIMITTNGADQPKIAGDSSLPRYLEANKWYRMRLEVKIYQRGIPDSDIKYQNPGSEEYLQIRGYLDGVLAVNYLTTTKDMCANQNSGTGFTGTTKAGVMIMNFCAAVDNFRKYSLSSDGWYRGDHHLHSTHQVSYECGGQGGDDGDQSPGEIADECRGDDRDDYLILTPHNQINHTKDQDDIGQNKKFEMECTEDFLGISEGCEETTATPPLYGISASDIHGHMGTYFTGFPRTKYSTEGEAMLTWSEHPDDLENKLKNGEAIKKVKDAGGFVYLNHPVSNSDSKAIGINICSDSMNWQEWTLGDLWGTAVKGIEVWSGSDSNAWSPWLTTGFWNNMAFEKWDELNNEGKKLWGMANTDSHHKDKLGKVWTVSHLKKFTKGGVRYTLEKTGEMYGTNGPLLYLRAESAGVTYEMGSAIPAIPSSGGNVTIRYGAAAVNGLNEITIYKNGIPLQELQKKAYPYNPDEATPNGFVPNLVQNEHFSYSDNKTTHENAFTLKVEPGDFVRMVVKAYDSGGKVTQFAFSNPIFVDLDSAKVILRESFSDKDPNDPKNSGKAWVRSSDDGFDLTDLRPSPNAGISTEHANDVTRAHYFQCDETEAEFAWYQNWNEAGEVNLHHYYVEANFRIIDPHTGKGFFGVMARYTDANNYIAFVCKKKSSSYEFVLQSKYNGTLKEYTIHATPPASGFGPVLNLRLELWDTSNGNTEFRCYVNGIFEEYKILTSSENLKSKGGKIGLHSQDITIWADDFKAMKLD